MAASAEGVITQGRAFSPLSPQTLRRALHLVFVVALVVAGLALATVVVPRAFGYGTLAVLSGSMGRSAPTGSLVIGSWQTSAGIEVGDVILVRRDGRAPVLHRVISRESESGRPVVRLKGDANPAPDPEAYTLPGRVLRKDWAIPFIGYVVGVLRVPAGWIVLVGLPTILLAFSVLRDVWRRPEERDEGKALATSDVVDDDADKARELADGLAAHDRRLRDRHAELAGAEAALTARTAALERREAAVRERERELDAREAAHAAHAEAVPAQAPAPPIPSAHVLLVPGPKGYAFVERETPPPGIGAVVEQDGAAYTVTRVGRSPFPSDGRRCVYLQAL
jgi:signal peptidase I